MNTLPKIYFSLKMKRLNYLYIKQIHLNNIKIKNMDTGLAEKGQIVLTRMVTRISNGEFEEILSRPFMSKKLFKTLIEKRINEEVSKGNNPVLSEMDISEILSDMKEVAKETLKVLITAGIIEITPDEVKVSSILK